MHEDLSGNMVFKMFVAPFGVSQVKRVIPFFSPSYQQKVAGVTMCPSRDSCRKEDNSKDPYVLGYLKESKEALGFEKKTRKLLNPQS